MLAAKSIRLMAEGADDPAELHTALEHEPVEQGQDEDQNRCLGEERRTAMRGDGDQIEERGGRFWGTTPPPDGTSTRRLGRLRSGWKRELLAEVKRS